MPNGTGFDIGKVAGNLLVAIGIAVGCWLFGTTLRHSEDIAVIKYQITQINQNQSDAKVTLDKVHGDVQVLLSRKP